MDDDYQEEETGPDYPDCIGCFHNHDTADGICNVSGPCQGHPNAESFDTPEPAPVELLMLPPAVITAANNGRLFT